MFSRWFGNRGEVGEAENPEGNAENLLESSDANDYDKEKLMLEKENEVEKPSTSENDNCDSDKLERNDSPYTFHWDGKSRSTDEGNWDDPDDPAVHTRKLTRHR